MKVLLIDDQRSAAFIKSSYDLEVTRVAKTFAEGINALKEQTWDLVLLDHDLNSFDEENNELTGSTIMYFLRDNPEYLPKDIFFVTANPVGRVNMQNVWNDIKRANGTSG